MNIFENWLKERYSQTLRQRELIEKSSDKLNEMAPDLKAYNLGYSDALSMVYQMYFDSSTTKTME